MIKRRHYLEGNLKTAASHTEAHSVYINVLGQSITSGCGVTAVMVTAQIFDERFWSIVVTEYCRRNKYNYKESTAQNGFGGNLKLF